MDRQTPWHCVTRKMYCDGNRIIALENDEKRQVQVISSLQDLISRGAPVKLRILLDVLEALEFFHNRGQSLGQASLLPTNILVVASSRGTRAILSEVQLSPRGNFNHDILAAGLLLNYVWTSGKQSYGDINTLPSEDSRKNLILKMTNNSCNITEVLFDPAFWSNKKKLNFLMKVSDILELKQNKHTDAVNKGDVFGKSWKKNLDPLIAKKVEIDSKKRRCYDDTSTKDLLRLVRNLAHHHHELAPEIKAILGPAEDLGHFWTSTFPSLLSSVHAAMAAFKADTNCARIKGFYH